MTLTEFLTNVANAIRSKTGSSEGLKAEDFPSAIGGISVGIVPTGTKSITTNGTHDVTSYASAEVKVPASGITPSGSINITENGTYDVTAEATAIVNVASNSVVRQITFDSDVSNTASPSTEKVLLADDPFVAEHYNDLTFVATLVPNFTPAAATGVIGLITQGNRLLVDVNNDYYGISLIYSSETAANAAYATTPLTGNGYTACFKAYNTGKLVLRLASTRIVKAGSYTLILTCAE